MSVSRSVIAPCREKFAAFHCNRWVGVNRLLPPFKAFRLPRRTSVRVRSGRRRRAERARPRRYRLWQTARSGGKTASVWLRPRRADRPSSALKIVPPRGSRPPGRARGLRRGGGSVIRLATRVRASHALSRHGLHCPTNTARRTLRQALGRCDRRRGRARGRCADREALAHAMHIEIVHRDVNPSNILLAGERRESRLACSTSVSRGWAGKRR